MKTYKELYIEAAIRKANEVIKSGNLMLRFLETVPKDIAPPNELTCDFNTAIWYNKEQKVVVTNITNKSCKFWERQEGYGLIGKGYENLWKYLRNNGFTSDNYDPTTVLDY